MPLSSPLIFLKKPLVNREGAVRFSREGSPPGETNSWLRMRLESKMSVCRRQFLRRGLPVLAALSLLGPSIAEEREEAKRKFKLPEGDASRTLKMAARQGRVDIVFSADFVKGVRTRTIKGEYAPSVAFNLMLKDSGFVVAKHRDSGVYLVRKQTSQAVELLSKGAR